MTTSSATRWMDANLQVQGFSLTADQAHDLRWGLRFSTALCLGLVITGLVLQSAILILALVPIGVLAGWTRRHPFDYLWNFGVRRIARAPALPPNPPPRRHSFKLGTIWLLTVGVLFAVGQPAIATALGAVLVGVCGFLTATNFCIPSTLLALWWRWREARAAAA
jgi:hypothetical protein